MKVYEITTNYDDKTRITVGPDVRCHRHGGSFDGGQMSITFERDVERYETEVLAAYANVRECVLLDDSIKLEVREYNNSPMDAVNATASRGEPRWVAA